MIAWRGLLVAVVLIAAGVAVYAWLRRSTSEPEGALGGSAKTVDPLVRKRLARFEVENPSVTDGYVLFVGSSTIERFPLESAFPGKRCVNRGVGNENAVDLLARIPFSLPAARPAGIVLYAGSADARWEPELTVTEIPGRVRAVVDALAARYPGVPIALLEVMSERDLGAQTRVQLATLTIAWRKIALDCGLTFVPTRRPPLVDDEGLLPVDVSSDRYHLNDRGYAALAGFLISDGGPVGRLLAP